MIRSKPTQALIGLVTLLALLSAPAALDAKRKKRVPPPPLKIVGITTFPVPFIPGNGPMAITVDVELPRDLRGVDVLEVSSLISFPSKRTIRFLVSRKPLEHVFIEQGKPRMRTTLLWDGRDQTQQYMNEGTYAYEVRAKLMANENGFAKAKVVSQRVRGTLEVSQNSAPPNRKRKRTP